MNLAQEIAKRTLAIPRVLWIELTSRCPFDCVFCTRKSLRGAGQHMDFGLYQQLIAELVAPSIIRLNYSGESGHYPRLTEAITLAAQTGAQTELVSAIASLKPDRVEAMLRAGLNRLTLSLHTLDAQRFYEIYRYSSLDSFMQRLDQVQSLAPSLTHPFQLDLAFVAMASNLDELPAVAAFAAARGINTLAVHPLIGRDPLPAAGEDEHGPDGRIRTDFAKRMADAVQLARDQSASITIQVSSSELDSWTTHHPLQISERSSPCPGPMPTGAEVAGCDQSPFDTIHVLADGRIVACEVTDKVVLGDLRTTSLSDIWQGDLYRSFRMRHRSGSESACRSCTYKQIALPRPSHRLDAAFRPALQLLLGFHSEDEDGTLWTHGHARFWLRRRFGDSKLYLRGLLPPPPNGKCNTLTVQITAVSEKETMIATGRESGSVVRQVSNDSALMSPVELLLPFDLQSSSCVLVDLRVSEPYRPFSRGDGSDLRELGFALHEARCARF